MATRFAEPCEGTNGVNVSSSNTAFTAVNVGTPPAFATAQKFLGNSSIDCSTTGSYRYGIYETSASALWGLRFYFRMGGFPSANSTLVELRSSSNDTRAQIQVITDGSIRIRNGTVAQWTSSSPLSVGVWYRVEAWFNANTSTMQMAVYVGDSLTSVASSGNRTFNTGTIAEVRLGNAINSSWSGLFLDQIIATDTASFPGPSTTPIGITTDNDFSMLRGDSHPVSMTKTNGSGTTTYAWTVSGPNNSTSQFANAAAQSTTFTPTLAGTYIITGTGTDGTGSDSDSTTVTVAEPARMKFSRVVTIEG